MTAVMDPIIFFSCAASEAIVFTSRRLTPKSVLPTQAKLARDWRLEADRSSDAALTVADFQLDAAPGAKKEETAEEILSGLTGCTMVQSFVDALSNVVWAAEHMGLDPRLKAELFYTLVILGNPGTGEALSLTVIISK